MIIARAVALLLAALVCQGFIPAGTGPTPSSQPGAFITSVTPGTVRSDYSGFVGMGIDVGPTALVVTSLGRYVLSGSTQSHQIALLDGALNVLGSVFVSTSGAPVGQFVYGTLSSPITLSAGARYYVLSAEVVGGDSWYHADQTVTTTADASLENGYAEASLGAPVASNGAGVNHPYVPTNFLYTLASTPPPPPNQQMVFIVDGVFSGGPGSSTFTEVAGGAGSANRPFYTFQPQMWPPEPPYSGGGYSLSGTDASFFRVNASTGVLSVGPSDVPAGDYGPINSGHTLFVSVGTITNVFNVHVKTAGSAWAEITTQPTEGGNVTGIIHNPTLTGSPVMILSYFTDQRLSYYGYQPQYAVPGGPDYSFSIPAQNQFSDENQLLRIVYYTDNPSLVYYALSGPIRLRPSQPLMTPPALPNTLPAPFSPTSVFTVCQSGCPYNQWTAAMAAANGLDFVKIVIQGPYAAGGCWGDNFNDETNMAHHLWIQGTGGSYPTLGWDACQGKGTIVWGAGNTAGDGSRLTIDNIRITNTSCADDGGAAVRQDGNGDVVIRNVILTATCMGLLTSNSGVGDTTVLNSFIARNGGNSGPSHNIYIGAGAGLNTYTMTNSISQQAGVGYELKTRAKNSIIGCNIFKGNIAGDTVNIHSSDIDFAEGRESHVTNNLIYQGNGLESASDWYWILWGGDVENTVLSNNFMVATGNYIINDFPAKAGGPGPTGNPVGVFQIVDNSPAWSPSPPYTIGPNTYVYAAGPGTPALGYFRSTSDNVGNGTVVFSAGSTIFGSRTAAGIANVTYPIPPACTAPIGLIGVP